MKTVAFLALALVTLILPPVVADDSARNRFMP